MIYLAKKSFKIAESFAFAICISRLWLNLVVMAGAWLKMHVIQWLPSCSCRCEGRMDITNAFSIFPCNKCPKSSRVSQNLTIDFSSSGDSSCCFSCAAPLGCASLRPSGKVHCDIASVEAAAQIDGSDPARYAC
jgi:hypothetical protein